MRIKYILVFVLIVCLAEGRSYAQSEKLECVERVRLLYKRFNTMTAAVKEGEQIYYRYSTKVFMHDSLRNHNTSSEVSVTVGKQKIQSISKEVIFYQDERDAFSVVPSKRIIYWMDSRFSFDEKYFDKNSVIKLQDTLFDLAIAKECRAVGLQEENIILSVREKGAKLFSYEEIELQVNHAKQVIKKIVISYPATGLVSRIEYVFHDVNTKRHDPEFQLSSKRRIFNADDTLVPQFREYHVVDARKKNNNSKSLKK